MLVLFINRGRVIDRVMTYSSCCGSCGGSGGYSSSNPSNLERSVNKFYINIGSLNVNNGIQHSIAAQQLGDVHVYNQTIDNRTAVQNNYTLNLDNRKVEFLSPYIDGGQSRVGPRQIGYSQKQANYLPYEKLLHNRMEYQSMITTGILKQGRPVVQFIEDAAEIKDIVIETFHALTGKEFPEAITIRVCDDKEMKKAHLAHGGTWSEGILGFAINRGRGISSIFVKKADLDALMLTVGHYIGHVLTQTLNNPVDEEAKAFAFELAWAKTIIKNDIGCLGKSFNVDFRPANNGLHDKAFNFVQSLARRGKEAIDSFWSLARGALTVASF
jgi:hypothetical protein